MCSKSVWSCNNAKEAVVFIVDTSPSMNRPYLGSSHCNARGHGSDESNGTNNTTDSTINSRLSCAKLALEGMLCNLMLQSKSNEAGVILLKTRETNHHLYRNDPANDNDNDNDNDSFSSKNNDNYHLNDSKSRCGEEDLPPFPNLTEMSPVRKPSIQLLRSIRDIDIPRHHHHGTSKPIHTSLDDQNHHNYEGTKATTQKNDNEKDNIEYQQQRGGDFCNGIILAASAMYARTHGKNYQRKIILFTDATHEVRIDDPDAMDKAVNDLRDMDCPLTVVGLDFRRSAYFEIPAGVDGDVHDEGECNDSEDSVHSEDTTNINNNNNKRDALIQSENEKLLISLTKWTGGQVLAPSSLQHILQSTAGRRIPRSALSRTTLIIAPPLPPLPDLSVSARISLRTVKANLPTLKREALQFNNDEQGNNNNNNTLRLNGAGEVMTTPIIIDTTHWDPDDPDLEVQAHERITAYSYGSDLIPIGPLDIEGLTRRAPPSVTILGYVSKKTIPISFLMGPTRVISGDRESIRADTVISALAQALWKLEQYAVCTFVGRQDADPLMGVLVPLIEEGEDNGYHNDRGGRVKMEDQPLPLPPPQSLLYIRMPFQEDWQNLTMMSLEDDNEIDEAGGTAVGGHSKFDNDAKICDDLIDSLMLPPNALRNELIPNPAIRAYHKTVMGRAIDPKSLDIMSTRQQKGDEDGEDCISTPPDILRRAKKSLDNFRVTFPMKMAAQVEGQNMLPNGKRKKRFWSDLE